MRSAYLPRLAEHGPRHRALEAAIRADIERGRLVPGERLPGTRTLARRLGLSRNTVLRAVDGLVAEGWLRSHPSSATVVAPRLATAPRGPAPEAGFDLPALGLAPARRTSAPPGCRLAMLGGEPDLRLLPLQELARAYRRVLRGRGRQLVAYGDPAGEPRLRAELSRWLAEHRGLVDDPARLLVTRGSQMALYLLAQALLRPGDRVAVEAYGYAPAWEALRRAGAELVPVPVDRDGLVVDALPDDVALVYLTPHHQYPTGALLGAARRTRLLAWAAARRIPLVEDDYDHEYHYEGTPVLPLAAMDRAGVVLSIGTLSKAFAPGVRIGWVAGPPPLIADLAALRRVVDRQGDRVVELAIAELIADGILARHMRRTRRIYARRRQALLDGLASLPVAPAASPGGMAVWCETSVDPDAWAARAEARGLFFSTGSAYRLDGQPSPHVRFGFAGLTVEEIGEALAIARAALP